MTTLPAPLQVRHQVEVHSDHRVAVAVALAPILLLLTLTLVVAGVVDVDTGVAVFLASSVWLVYELHRYLQTIGKADTAAAAEFRAR